MSKILVSGLVNIENNIKIDGFPIEYEPIKYHSFGIKTCVSGVGFNVAKALTVLGSKASLISIIGNDINGSIVLNELEKLDINRKGVKNILDETAQSIILYDNQGKRQINSDLKNIQEVKYPEDDFEEVLLSCDMAVLCNINFSRPLLKKAKENGKLIATDVHCIESVEDVYNKDFMSYADILFFSNEKLKEPYEDFVKVIAKEFNNKIIVVGLGSKGSLLYSRDDDFIGRIKAVNTNEVVNTVGAGDALFSAFNHFYCNKRDAFLAIKKASVFVSYKIRYSGASNGFVKEDVVNEKTGEISW